MKDELWARVREAFDAAIDAPPGEREAVVHRIAAGDAAVIREAMALLALEPGGFLDGGAFAMDPALLQPLIAPDTDVGGYRVVRLVGRGGMGEVYEAIRSGPDFQKRVAVKILRAGAGSTDAVRRFERERRILAGLEHRNIAPLIDGGLLSDGRPYLVMEFVEGERITDWCSSHGLSLDARLVLFRQICGAVSHAHRNLIVHRDLKPSNILVATDGTVKLLDFGIAKALDPETGAGSETATRPELTALTPEYAAPEQLTGGNVTTATDVYALGLLLFELLTGSRPFAGATTIPELTRRVLSDDPPMASDAINRARLGTGADTVRRNLRGDLDAILLRALRTDPLSRYGTVDELVDDLRRHQDGMPVEAMRGHRGYRAAKFVRRNRGAVIATTLIAVATVTAVISTARESRRTNIQRARAETTNRFLTGMLSSVNPSAAGKDVMMVQVLDSAASRIAGDTTMDPEVEASLRTAIGRSYTALGKFDAAEPHLRRALELQKRNASSAIPVAEAYRDLALVFDGRGAYPVADTLYQRAIAVLPAANDSATTELSSDLMMQRARLESIDGKLAAAATIIRDVVAREERQFGPASAQVATAQSQLGVTLAQAGDFAGAEVATRSALRTFRQLYRPPNPDIGKTLGRLATVLEQSGQAAPADSAYRESLQMLAATLGADHPDVTWIRYNYAGFLLDNKKWDEAIRQADSVLQLRGGTIPEVHYTIAASMQAKGLALSGLGDHSAAATALRESLALRQKYNPPDHWLVGSSESVLGAELMLSGSRVEALHLLQDGCRIVRKALGPDNPRTKAVLARLRKGDSTATCS